MELAAQQNYEHKVAQNEFEMNRNEVEEQRRLVLYHAEKKDVNDC